MTRITAWLDKTLYPNHGDHWDHKLLRGVLQTRLKADYRILDFGAGRGHVEDLNLRGQVAWVVGVDPDEAVLRNPFLDEAKPLRSHSLEVPYGDNTFDLVLSANVLEHLQEPEPYLREAHRVLRPGGLLVVKTPNKWHYVSTIARMAPHWLHVVVNRARGVSRCDIFPTAYKCNTRGTVERCAKRAGFAVVEIMTYEGRPEYLRIAPPLYLLGYLYERLVNSAPLFSRFRCVIIAVLQKPST